MRLSPLAAVKRDDTPGMWLWNQKWGGPRIEEGRALVKGAALDFKRYSLLIVFLCQNKTCHPIHQMKLRFYGKNERNKREHRRSNRQGSLWAPGTGTSLGGLNSNFSSVKFPDQCASCLFFCSLAYSGLRGCLWILTTRTIVISHTMFLCAARFCGGKLCK